jgi:hypothetical protein
MVEPSEWFANAPVDVEAPVPVDVEAPLGPDGAPPAGALKPEPRAAEAVEGIPTCKTGATTPSTRAAVAGRKNANTRKAVMTMLGMRMSLFDVSRLITLVPQFYGFTTS